MSFEIKYIKDGKTFTHRYYPKTKEEALGVGHELTRDKVADFFKVTKAPSDCAFDCPNATLEPNPDVWGDDWPRCSSCGMN